MANSSNSKTKQDENNLLLTLAAYRKLIDKELFNVLKKRNRYEMYKHMSYFLGFLDEKLQKEMSLRGKRFRPSLTLLISGFYGKVEAALPAALSIELFHNFTLIHDDIVDNDEYRRGRKTVWKVWGRDHAINSGDAQHALANAVLSEGYMHDPKNGLAIQNFLHERYIEIAEGQFLDFTLSDSKLGDKIVNKKTYLEMITKKAAVLVGASTAVAGLANGVSKKEEDTLYQYGLNLGIAYQLYDDVASIWGDTDVTGKASLGDIAERKKTLPILFALDALPPKYKKELISLYNQKTKLSKKAQLRIVELLESVDARAFAKREVERYIKKAEKAIADLPFSHVEKEQLRSFNHNLLHG